MDRVSRFNVAHRYEKRSLLILVNCVAALSIFFFGYDQGVMGGVNDNRSYAAIMGFGYYDESQGLVVVTKSLLQGGIVRLSTLSEFNGPLLTCRTLDCCLLSPRQPFRRLPRRMDWRSVWPHQDHRLCRSLGDRRCDFTMLCPECPLDVLRSYSERHRYWDFERHNTCMGDRDGVSYLSWPIRCH